MVIDVKYWRREQGKFRANAARWYGFGASWTLINLIDRVIGYALMGLALGAVINRLSPRATTNEWGGVKAQDGLSSKMGAPTSGARS